MFFKFKFLLILVVVTKCSCEAEPPKVTLSHGGIVVGGIMRTVSGKGILAFRGIPYAQPPVGDLRFEPPQLIQPWIGEHLANRDPNMCIHVNTFELNFDPTGSEDCLYLNVYVPKERNKSTLLSVMVYIHGGGWVTGSGNSDLHGPQRLLDHDIILVTGNYRLGALGFFSTGTLDCPGNNGFKDQVLMLKWVRENIQNFGGNPNDVTLFGENAGSASVSYHMYSERSKGLFHKAIMQSGSIFNGWAMVDPKIAAERAEKFGKNLNCTRKGDDWSNMLKCLKNVPASDIVFSIERFSEYFMDPIIFFPGVVEPEHENAFLSKHPRELGNDVGTEIPIIVGGTTDEGAIQSGVILNYVRDEFIRRFYESFPLITGYKNLSRKKLKKLIQLVDDFYFNNTHNWSKENHQNLTNFISDQRFNFGMDKFLRKRFSTANAEVSFGSTFVYLFNHRGPKSATELFFHGGPEYYGVCHTDDLPYIFYNDFSKLEGDENDKLMKLSLPKLWANFARTGNPTPGGSDLPVWQPADGFPIKYARLGSKTPEDWTLLENQRGLMEERMEFWRNAEKLFDI